MNTSVNSAEIKIASIQMVSTADLWENLSTANRLITAAAADGAQIVVLPEYFCLMGLKDTDKVSARESIGKGPIQEQLSNIAIVNNLYLVAGTIPLDQKGQPIDAKTLETIRSKDLLKEQSRPSGNNSGPQSNPINTDAPK